MNQALNKLPSELVIDVQHDTHYEYDHPVELAHHQAHLRPRGEAWQQVLMYDLMIEPEPTQHYFEHDTWGNQRECFSILTPHTHLLVRSHSQVRVSARPAILEAHPTLSWEQVRSRLQYQAGKPCEPESEFSFPSPYIPLHRELRAYARRSFRQGRPVAQAAYDLMVQLHRDFTYAPASTAISTPVLQAFKERRGVCQDYAHVMLGCLRALGLAACYVSGYLLTRTSPTQEKLIGADASHAWIAVWCPPAPGAPSDSAHWLELDPTNCCVADVRHIRLAIGRDYGDVTPLRGIIRGGGEHALTVEVTTTALDLESP